MDFSLVKQRAREVCQELDHRFVLQARSTSVAWELRDGEIEVRHGDRRYVMPASDVAPLEIDNSTAERLAEWFAARVWEKLQEQGAGNVRRVTVGIEEMPGQAGWFSLNVADHRA
jgi:6-pyruvoyltetrahydropterin/6-carboxytetrahydropterin synthase